MRVTAIIRARDMMCRRDHIRKYILVYGKREIKYAYISSDYHNIIDAQEYEVNYCSTPFT